jgi:eukaryotic-like serine/threonine-protein kinase
VNVADRYRLVRRIATGGMGTVYEGVDERLGRRVAVKVLKEEYADDPRSQERFSREARAAAMLNHPHIAQVFDSGQDASGAFIVMEYVDGPHLGQLLEIEGRLAPWRAVGIAADMCSALGAAHAVGIVHRDVKPSNVLLTPHHQVKVTDFGIAQAQGQAALTGTGMVLGTAHYLSPEQASGQGTTPASDVYAVGVLLFQLLTGSVPFDSDSPVAVALSHATQEVPPVTDLAPDVPPRVAAAVAHATAKDPRQRFADASLMEAELRAALAGRATQAMPVAPVAATGQREVGHRARRSVVRTLAILAGVGLLLVGLVALGIQILGHDPADSTADQTADRAASNDRRESPRRSPSKATQDKPRSTGPVVPDEVIGADAKEIEEQLEELGYDTDKVTIDSAAPKDSILATVPAPGDPLESGQTILLVASKGKPPKEPSSYVVPDELIGADADEAEEYLEDQELKVETVEIDSDGDQNGIIATYPDPGALADSGTIVLVVADEDDD